MTKQRPDGIRDYEDPAGGWGALKALASALKQQQLLVEGIPTLLKQNQPGGFDCPGCAWPDPKHTSAFEFCENGAKAVTWESTPKRAGPDFFAQHTLASLWTRSDFWLEDQGRLTHPLRYDAATDRYEPVAWQAAFDDIAGRLNSLDHPDQLELYTSGRASNEAAFLFQLFGRQFGTNNFPDCSNMCHEPTSVGLPRSIGVGKGTVTLDDFDKAELIISIGHNPGTNHPRMMTPLRNASRRGAKIIVLNPLRERALERFEAPQAPIEMATTSSTPIASRYFQVKVGGDAAALKGICKALVAKDEAARAADRASLLDHPFIAGHTARFEAFSADLASCSWGAIERASGLSRADLEAIADDYAASNSTIVCYGMGITQHVTGTANVQQIANLLLLKGNIGKPGAGICPLRGHSNVQGDRTVGITERPSTEFLDRLRDVFGFEPPRAFGHSVVDSIAAMREGRAKAVICLGGNLAMAASDPQACFKGFRQLDLAVHLATKLNRTHLLAARATYLFPVLGRTDSDVQVSGRQALTVEDSMSMVHASRGFLTPPSDQVRSEPAILAGIAKATLAGRSRVDWEALAGNYDLIRDAIEQVFPEFEAYNDRIRRPGGFQLPNAAAMRIWKTPNGKANFAIFAGVEEDPTSVDPEVLRLTSLRAHDQYNTTIYGLNDRYRGVFGRRDVLLVNPRELERLGFVEGDVVDVVTALDFARSDRIVQGLTLVSHNLPDGCCASYYPEIQPLVALEFRDPDCLTPSYKSIPVKIMRAQAPLAGDRAVTRDGIVGRLPNS
ncbi:FdhF/YdeP family oxidoreductase [Bradyrhizobium sp. HKCCYLR20261]|uniref:FdhF/YdeP family oxidoreductase n=1 Tax=Bradyrhizobium sp. HKCCYLR20261 TaxID=3420760 RepID=UPI003EBD0A60